MKRGFTFLLFSILFYCTSFGQQRPVVDFYADVITAGPNDTICIPVKVKNFNNILGVGLGMRWLPGRLTFLEVRTNFALNDISSNDFGLTDVENGNLKLSWITSNFPSGASLDDDATIFEVCFVQSGNLAEDRFSYLSFDDEFLVPEVILDENVEDFPLAYANFTPGGVFITSGSLGLQMSPEIDFTLDCGTVNVSLNPNVFGGTAPYQYDWSGPGLIGAVSTPTLEGELDEGTYVVEVMDEDDNIISGVIEVDFMGNEEGLL